MKAVVIKTYGGTDVMELGTLPDPEAGRGNVRIRVKAAGVQPVDCAVRSGWFAGKPAPFQVNFPQILGNEFAGIVDSIGDGVDNFAVGDEVLGWASLASYAEYVVVSPEQLIHKPRGITWEAAGGLSGAGQTAHTAIEELQIKSGETILIHAAAGAVGTVAVQLAKHIGATVIGTASEQNHDYLRSLGAIPVVYGNGLAERVRPIAPKGADAVLDAAGRGAIEESVKLIENRDRIVTIVDFDAARLYNVRSIRSQRSVARLSELVDLIENDQLHIHIRKTYPLPDVADAHRDVERGHGRGKVVLKMD